MMTEDQAKIVSKVYRQFMASESSGWNEVDDYLEYLEYLDDDQLHRESDVLYSSHKGRNAHCGKKHPTSECFIPTIIEAVAIILELYKETGNLHKNNRYVLEYYLALTQAGAILVD